MTCCSMSDGRLKEAYFGTDVLKSCREWMCRFEERVSNDLPTSYQVSIKTVITICFKLVNIVRKILLHRNL